MSTLNITIPVGFTGRLDLPGFGTVTVRPVEDEPAADLVEPEPEPAADPVPAPSWRVARLLRNFGRYTLHMRALYDGMVEQGYEFHAPESDIPGREAAAEYLRAVYAGKRRRVSLYINSRSIRTGAGGTHYANKLPGAVGSYPAVTFQHDNVNDIRKILEGVTGPLARWADGEE
jgi:hypothetical protein